MSPHLLCSAFLLCAVSLSCGKTESPASGAGTPLSAPDAAPVHVDTPDASRTQTDTPAMPPGAAAVVEAGTPDQPDSEAGESTPDAAVSAAVPCDAEPVALLRGAATDLSGIAWCDGDLVVEDLRTECNGLGAGKRQFDETGFLVRCETDADCATGSCIEGGCEDAPLCEGDAECAATEACVCANPLHYANECVVVECRHADDCAPGYRCVAHLERCPGLRISGIYCHGPEDECQSSVDCESGWCSYDSAALDGRGLWICREPTTCE